MSVFIENLNNYLEFYGIRQNFLSVRSGMSEDKISKILNEKKKITYSEMESLANALGKKIEFFLTEFPDLSIENRGGRLAFYVGEPGKNQAEVAYKLVEFVENLDEVLNGSSWYLNAGITTDEF